MLGPSKVKKRAKIRNRYNQAPHLTQNTNRKVTTSQLDITNDCQDASPFPGGDHKATIDRRTRKHSKNKAEITKMIHKRSTALEPSVKYTGLMARQPKPLVQMWIKTHRCLVSLNDS